MGVLLKITFKLKSVLTLYKQVTHSKCGVKSTDYKLSWYYVYLKLFRLLGAKHRLWEVETCMTGLIRNIQQHPILKTHFIKTFIKHLSFGLSFSQQLNSALKK